MKKDQIHLDDWHRILFGEVPGSFYVELIIRALVVYLLLMVAMRAMGKRMSSQLSRNELAALVSLAAAIGVPMMAPNRGLLPAVVIAIVVISIGRFIAARAATNQTFEKISQGNISIIISDSVIDIDTLEGIGLSQKQLFAQLRAQSISQTGMVDRLYMEANGAFTLIKRDNVQPGLTVLPDDDPEFKDEQEKSRDTWVCDTCGTAEKAQTAPLHKCPHCGRESWTKAVI